MSSSPPMTLGEFQATTNVSRETLERLERYAELLKKWTGAINLVSRDSQADLWGRHMMDSAQLFPLLPDPPVGRPRVLVDLGSGAGFPGLVLAILGAGEVHLIDSDLRKGEFLREAARLTQTRITIHSERIEALTPFPADVVTARACASLAKLIDYASPFLRPDSPGDPGGVGLFLKGRDVDRELTELPETWKMQLDVITSCTEPRAKIVRLRRQAKGSDPS